jgi:peptidoglycan/LPS O-acetylase OafA/YrhL
MNHLETHMTGGYVGVDVFFVISGYLISANILSDMVAGKFTIVGFYERRVRRIFPALLVMLLVVTLLAYRYLIPSEMESYSRSLLAALLSVSNFFFWHKGGYFDQPGLEPLLHTWSLGVEEQFYILFPLLLVVIRRWFPRRMKPAIVGISAVSFIAACLTVRSHAIAAFFFAPLRAWELLMGTIVSQKYIPSLRGSLARNLASGVGLLLILVPGWRYDDLTVFPGLTALPPCLGAAMIIAAGETGTSLVGQLLSWRPIAFIGLISYSLYLWHWPIIVFQDAGEMVMHGAILTRPIKIAISLLSIAVATLSWRFVEQPFRSGRFRPGRRAVFAISGFASLLLAVAAAGMLWTHGMRWRFPADALRVADSASVNAVADFGAGTCFLGPENTFQDFSKEVCMAPPDGRPSILFVGDSHAGMLRSGLAAVFPDRELMQATASDCAPLVESTREESENCKNLLNYVFNDYLLHHRVGVLLLEARWRRTDLDGVGATIEYAHAHNIPVVLMGPSIEYDKPEARLVILALRDGRLDEVQEHRLIGPQNLDSEMAMLARTNWHVPYISIYQALCKPDCPVFAVDSVPLLFDRNHLQAEGSILLAKDIRANGQLP